jgi:hypothetical protein
MKIRIVKQGNAKDRPFCPFVIDYPPDMTEK